MFPERELQGFGNTFDPDVPVNIEVPLQEMVLLLHPRALPWYIVKS